MSASTLYRKHTQSELVALQSAITSDPSNRSTVGIYLYTKAARKKLDDIARAITWHLEDRRAAAGRPVPTNGYSGRNSKRGVA